MGKQNLSCATIHLVSKAKSPHKCLFSLCRAFRHRKIVKATTHYKWFGARGQNNSIIRKQRNTIKKCVEKMELTAGIDIIMAVSLIRKKIYQSLTFKRKFHWSFPSKGWAYPYLCKMFLWWIIFSLKYTGCPVWTQGPYVDCRGSCWIFNKQGQ